MKKAVVLIEFVDKDTNVLQKQGAVVEYDDKRAEYLSERGFVKIEKVEKPVIVEKAGI